jgi:hypothetical protein
VGGVLAGGNGKHVNGGPSAPQPQGARSGAADRVTLDRDEEFGGARLLVSDTRVAFMLVNEARYRTVDRLFGVTREQSNLLTLIALGMLARAAHDQAVRVFKGPGGPTRADAAMGAGLLRESLYGIAGPASRTTPYFGALVAIALLGRRSHPALRWTSHGIRAVSRQGRLFLDHRYRRPSRGPRSGGSQHRMVSGLA